MRRVLRDDGWREQGQQVHDLAPVRKVNSEVAECIGIRAQQELRGPADATHWMELLHIDGMRGCS